MYHLKRVPPLSGNTSDAAQFGCWCDYNAIAPAVVITAFSNCCVAVRWQHMKLMYRYRKCPQNLVENPCAFWECFTLGCRTASQTPPATFRAFKLIRARCNDLNS